MIGKELKKLLIEENLKMVDLSKILGISQGTLSNYANDVSDPDVKTLRLIKEKYKEVIGKNLNLNWLISGEGEMFIQKVSYSSDITFEEYEKNFLQHLQAAGIDAIEADENGFLRVKKTK